jgi:hypothetical protein
MEQTGKRNKVRAVLVLILVGLATAATAQQPAPQEQPPLQQALANRLMNEINTTLQCQAQLITATKELEELRKKHEEKSGPPPPTK